MVRCEKSGGSVEEMVLWEAVIMIPGARLSAVVPAATEEEEEAVVLVSLAEERVTTAVAAVFSSKPAAGRFGGSCRGNPTANPAAKQTAAAKKIAQGFQSSLNRRRLRFGLAGISLFMQCGQ